MDLSRVSIGLPGATAPETVARVASTIEAAGFSALWINDTPNGDSLVGLHAAADVTSTLVLATGVIPVDRRSASDILSGAAGLPMERLTIGIGSGSSKRGLELVGDAVAELRDGTAASVVVGALGPRMRRLAAERADGVLLNWLTPAAAADALADLHRDAAGRPIRGVLYIRTAVDAAAIPALEAESARYDSSPAYAANLARIGAKAIDTTIAAIDPGTLAPRVDEYAAIVDEVVLRVITADSTSEQILAFIDRVIAEA